MKIELRLFATLQQYLPPGTMGRKATIDVEDGLTVRALIQRLAIPPELAQMVLVNGQDVGRKQERVLQDGDTLSIFPPVAGGSVDGVITNLSVPRGREGSSAGGQLAAREVKK